MDEAGNSLGACTFGMVGRLALRVRSGKHSNENDGLALLLGRHAAPLLAASSCRRWGGRQALIDWSVDLPGAPAGRRWGQAVCRAMTP